LDGVGELATERSELEWIGHALVVGVPKPGKPEQGLDRVHEPLPRSDFHANQRIRFGGVPPVVPLPGASPGIRGHPTDRSYDRKDHVGVVADDSPLLPELITWTQRLDGDPAPTTCTG
jgi:hypothetical protein